MLFDCDQTSSCMTISDYVKVDASSSRFKFHVWVLLASPLCRMQCMYVFGCDINILLDAQDLFQCHTLPNFNISLGCSGWYGNAAHASLLLDDAVPQGCTTGLTVTLVYRVWTARLRLRLPRPLRSSSCFRNQRQLQLDSRTAQLVPC